MAEPEELVDLAVAVACEAGELLSSYADRRSLGVETKSSVTDPVSEADHASERLIVERLTAARPDDGLLGEESEGERRGSSGLRWVVDPLDGTVNFLYGIPQWCVSVACEDAEGPLVGVVHDPSRDETFRAVRGGGAWLGETRLEVSRPDEPTRALVATGFAYDAEVRAAQGVLAADLLRRARDLRRGGAAALDLAWTAAGRVDGYYEFELQPWDWAAGRLLVTEAGGTVTEVERQLAGRVRQGLVAGSGPVHDHLRAWLVT